MNKIYQQKHGLLGRKIILLALLVSASFLFSYPLNAGGDPTPVCPPPVTNLIITGPSTVYWSCGQYYTFSIQNPTGGACYIWSFGGVYTEIVSGQYSSSVTVKYQWCYNPNNPNTWTCPGPGTVNVSVIQFDNCNYSSCPPRRGEKNDISVRCP